MKNRPEYAPLWAAWKRFKNKGALDEEWSDFEAFFNDIVDAGWSEGDYIKRVRNDEPIGPDNFFIQKCVREKKDAAKVAEKAEQAEAKGGSANSPCIGCPYEIDGECEHFRRCKRYKMWMNACWRDFRIAAERLSNEKA